MGADDEGERETLATDASGALEADSGRVSSASNHPSAGVVEPSAAGPSAHVCGESTNEHARPRVKRSDEGGT